MKYRHGWLLLKRFEKHSKNSASVDVKVTPDFCSYVSLFYYTSCWDYFWYLSVERKEIYRRFFFSFHVKIWNTLLTRTLHRKLKVNQGVRVGNWWQFLRLPLKNGQNQVISWLLLWFLPMIVISRVLLRHQILKRQLSPQMFVR